MNESSSLNPLQYLREVRQELDKVTWPSREETLQLTLVVILVSIALAVYLGGLDYLLTQAIQMIV
jgi:preprotein translocase subunit SecE